MLPDRVTTVALEGEFKAACEWAKRERVQLDCDIPHRLLRAVFERADPADRFFLRGRFDSYKALPPIWEWCDASWSDAGNRTCSPDPASTDYGSSLFLDNGTSAIICAPFNRLAYSAHGGPHGDWGLADWMNVRGVVYAVTVADMLQTIARDFHYTTRRMA